MLLFSVVGAHALVRLMVRMVLEMMMMEEMANVANVAVAALPSSCCARRLVAALLLAILPAPPEYQHQQAHTLLPSATKWQQPV